MISRQLGLRVVTTSAKPTRRHLRPKRRCEIGSLIIGPAIKCGTPEQSRASTQRIVTRNWQSAFRDEALGCGAFYSRSRRWLAALDLQLLVCRRQRTGQASYLYAIHRRLPGLRTEMRRCRRYRLR